MKAENDYLTPMPQSPAFPYSIRLFLPEDLQLYRAIRLEALQLEPGMFGSNYAREASFTDQQWLDRINGHNSDCFGLFYGNQLIGVTGNHVTGPMAGAKIFYIMTWPCSTPFLSYRLSGRVNVASISPLHHLPGPRWVGAEIRRRRSAQSIHIPVEQTKGGGDQYSIMDILVGSACLAGRGYIFRLYGLTALLHFAGDRQQRLQLVGNGSMPVVLPHLVDQLPVPVKIDAGKLPVGVMTIKAVIQIRYPGSDQLPFRAGQTFVVP